MFSYLKESLLSCTWNSVIGYYSSKVEHHKSSLVRGTKNIGGVKNPPWTIDLTALVSGGIAQRNEQYFLVKG